MDKSKPADLGRSIRAIRCRLGLSQTKFAEIAFGETRNNNISRYERSQVIPNPRRLLILLDLAATKEECDPILRAIERDGVSISKLLLSAPPETSINDTGAGCNV
jgi:transcriptional regulator with XRE-family HTH domain